MAISFGQTDYLKLGDRKPVFRTGLDTHLGPFIINSFNCTLAIGANSCALFNGCYVSEL